MEMAFEKMAKQSLRTDQFNWRNLLTHPSEFVRVDEQLRLKQLELNDFNELTPGYNLVAAQTHLEHQRLLYSMRCYLSISGMNFFNIPIVSANEFQSLKNSFVDRENYLTELNDFIEISKNEDEFWLIMQTSTDKINSEKFFKKIMSEVLSNYYISKDEKEKVMDVVINKCHFTVK
jgi:hypothetical protein